MATEDGKLSQSLGAVPDVAVRRPQGYLAVFEVETLFGKGGNGVKKIQETIEKYSSKGVTVNVVLDPFCLLLHLKEV